MREESCEKDRRGNLRVRNFTRFLLGVGVKCPLKCPQRALPVDPKVQNFRPDGESNGMEFPSITFRNFGYT